nr:uncharacterized protein LOC104112924 isoform X4 [Nicotiana tomentosiformis]
MEAEMEGVIEHHSDPDDEAELDEMMKRLKEIEDGVAAPREMQVKVEKEWCCSRNKALKYYKCRRPRSLKAFSVLFSSHYYMRTMTI